MDSGVSFGYLAGIGGLPVVLVYLTVNIAVIRAFRTEFRDESRPWRTTGAPPRPRSQSTAAAPG